MINISIVEDDEIFREGIRKYLVSQNNFNCELAVDSIETLIEYIKPETIIDIILMDIGLPGISGVSGVKMIKEIYPQIEVIMLTVYSNPDKIFDSLRNGAVGYLLKDTSLEELKRTIETVYSGGSFMSPEIARMVIDRFNDPGKIDPDYSLTPKEKQVVSCLEEGFSYKMIGDKLQISVDTVRFHIKNIYRKLHVNSKTDLIKKSLRGEI